MSTNSMSPATSSRNTRKTAYAVVLVAIGVALAPYTSFPIGIAKVNPTQHFVNVMAGVLLGPWWAVLTAMVIGILRNAMGLGTLLAFPGGMIGDRFELSGSLAFVDLGAGADGTEVGAGLHFFVTDNLALGLSLDVDEDATAYGAGVRLYF